MTTASDPVVESVEAYSAHACGYEAEHASKMRAQAERFAASMEKPSTILDAGCGPGRDLARFVAAGHLACGIDLSSAFVAMANRHAPTTLGDLRHVDELFAPGTFDGIWAAASLVHLSTDDTARVLGHFAGLLVQGGKLYACVRCTGETGWLDEPDGRRWYTVWEPDAFVALVARAGFRVDEVDHDVFVEVWATRQ